MNITEYYVLRSKDATAVSVRPEVMFEMVLSRPRLCRRLQRLVRRYWQTFEKLRYHSKARAPFALVDAVFYDWHQGYISIGSVNWILQMGINRNELIESCIHEYIEEGNNRDDYPCKRERFEDMTEVLSDIRWSIDKALHKADMYERSREIYYTPEISRLSPP